jgi:GntR family transcriptional regulator
MFLRVDLSSAEPLFEQISFAVKEAVARGELAQGAKLPSVRELAQELSINPNTVVRAYEALERDGVVTRRQGAGCFVTGRASSLNGKERRRQLVELALRTVTEGYHLGFSAEEIRDAVEGALSRLQFERQRKENG